MNSDEITLKLINNSTVDAPVSIFGSPATGNNTRISNVLVVWDLSAEPFTGANMVYSTASGTFNFPNSNPKSTKDVVALLQTTGVGRYWTIGNFIYATELLSFFDRSGTINIF